MRNDRVLCILDMLKAQPARPFGRFFLFTSALNGFGAETKESGSQEAKAKLFVR